MEKKCMSKLRAHEKKDEKMYKKVDKLEKKSPAQKKAMKGKSAAKRHEIEGGEKANKKLRAERKR